MAVARRRETIVSIRPSPTPSPALVAGVALSLALHAPFIAGRAPVSLLLSGAGTPIAFRPEKTLRVAIDRGMHSTAPLMAQESVMVETPAATDEGPRATLPTRPAPPEKRMLDGVEIVMSVKSDASPQIDPVLADALKREAPAAIHSEFAFDPPLDVAYPAEAIFETRQVNVRALVVVQEDGTVEHIGSVLEIPAFVDAFKAALEKTRAVPVLRDGRPVKVWNVLDFWFELRSVIPSEAVATSPPR